jgi:hypothetical protein
MSCKKGSCKKEEKREDKGEKGEKYEKFDKLKAKKIYTRDLKAKNARFCMADVESLTAKNADFVNVDVKDIDAEQIFLNGKDINCLLNRPAISSASFGFDAVGPTGTVGCERFSNSACPIKPNNVNQAVWDCLIENAISEGFGPGGIQERIKDGRDFIRTFLASRGCPESCPPGPTGTIPLEIYGTKTIPVFRRVAAPCEAVGSTGPFCGVTGPTGTTNRMIANIDYNLDIVYLLEEADSIDARVVSVLVQVGYIEPAGPTGSTGSVGGCTGSSENVIIETVFIGNKQYYPTLDITYGENYSASITIPSSIVLAAIAAMPDPCNTGAIQLVVYKEEGISIWVTGSESRDDDEEGGNSPVTSTETPVPDICTGVTCPEGQRPVIYGPFCDCRPI